MSLPHAVRIHEVGPRDGLQNVTTRVPTDVKVAFVDDLAAAGLASIEATAFVSAERVPQLDDGAEVLARIRRMPGVRYSALVPNERGVVAAIAARVDEVAVFTAASDPFNLRNVNATHAKAMERFAPVAQKARAAGIGVRGYVSTAFGCPYQGDVAVADVIRVVGDLFDLGCAEVSVGDTIGVADPVQVRRVVDALAARSSPERLALHLHDTYGRGLANVMAGLEGGIATFDASAGGLGGCPYAPGASGNLATEDLCALLERLGIATGVDLHGLVRASVALAASTGLELPSRALAALRSRFGL